MWKPNWLQILIVNSLLNSAFLAVFSMMFLDGATVVKSFFVATGLLIMAIISFISSIIVGRNHKEVFGKKDGK
jgi:uncharacterized membrane protein